MASSQPSGRRSSTLAPLLGALAVAVVAIVLVVTLGNGRDPGSPTGSEGTAVARDKALACPRQYRQTGGDTNGWVPHAPRGVNGDDRLVSDDTPTHAVVCAYLDGAEPNVSKEVSLTGRSKLSGSLSGLVRTLSALPRISSTSDRAGGCASVLTKADSRDYLFGLSYGSATLWVSAPGYRCAGSTNGSFITGTNVAGYASASYAAKKWVARK
ncbi:hypothetical protein [uncultured Jatrophihabitans sp.]|uniref:hypothetical protein n=1 Tax=uncultured Jatrophihabitans sp. TaxID=1610747 RepID=UPI0035CB9F2E